MRPMMQSRCSEPVSWGFLLESSVTLLRLGILFSCSGDYAALGRDCRDGAELAIAELQARGTFHGGHRTGLW